MELDSLIPGEYTLANGYSAIGIDEKKTKKGDFSISPNPASSLLNITDQSGDSSVKEVYVFSVNGRLIMSDEMKSSLNLDISRLKNGNYLVYVMKEKSEVFSGKFVVTK